MSGAVKEDYERIVTVRSLIFGFIIGFMLCLAILITDNIEPSTSGKFIVDERMNESILDDAEWECTEYESHCITGDVDCIIEKESCSNHCMTLKINCIKWAFSSL